MMDEHYMTFIQSMDAFLDANSRNKMNMFLYSLQGKELHTETLENRLALYTGIDNIFMES